VKQAPVSIRTRLAWGALLVLLAFLAIAGWAVQQAYADSLRSQRYARLQTSVYLLMAAAELDDSGGLVMPASLADPRLALPGSGLYASISNPDKGESWRSASSVGVLPPFQRSLATGQWQFETLGASAAPGGAAASSGRAFLAVTFAVKWAVNDQAVKLVFSVLEDRAEFDRELADFQRTLWSWLLATGLLLLLTQAWLLRWGLAPLGQIAREIQHIESGAQSKVEGSYPRELAGLSHNLNLLIDQQQARQSRYKDALADLAHSLKTPLAAMRAALAQPDELPATVEQQVSRMDDIVRHQLGRAGASGANRFAPYLALAPVLHRICDTLIKVHGDKRPRFRLDCPPELTWRLDEGDAFEILGNLLDNAAKWARQTVEARIWLNEQGLNIRVTDDGPGFSKPQPRLERGVRMDESVAGHGIGLFVVNDLVASYRGELKMGNAAAGGAQVDVVLPKD
jgi:two-component system sensor histidine kinase PhoQ